MNTNTGPIFGVDTEGHVNVLNVNTMHLMEKILVNQFITDEYKYKMAVQAMLD